MPKKKTLRDLLLDPTRTIWTTISIDKDTINLLDKAIVHGVASSRADVIRKGVCQLLGETYYTIEEHKFQQRMAADKALIDIIDDPHHGKAEMDEIIRLAREKYGDKPIDVPKDF